MTEGPKASGRARTRAPPATDTNLQSSGGAGDAEGGGAVMGSGAPPPSKAAAVVHKNSAFPPDDLQHLVTLANSFLWGGGGSRAWRQVAAGDRAQTQLLNPKCVLSFGLESGNNDP